MIKRLCAILLSATIISSFLQPISSFAQEPSLNEISNSHVEINTLDSKNSQREYLNEIEKFLVLYADGTIGLSSDVPDTLYNEYDLNSLEQSFVKLNEKVYAKEISFNDDFSINQLNKSIDSRILQHSNDYKWNYWWGISIDYCYNCAREAILESMNGSNTLFIMAILAPGAALPAIWFNDLQGKMSYHLTSRGVTVDINWATVKTVYGR